MLSANYKPVEWWNGRATQQIGAGQLVTSLDSLAALSGNTRENTRRVLLYLEKNMMIHTEKTTRYTLVTVCNWGDYQEQAEAKNTPSNTATDTPPISEPAKNNTPDDTNRTNKQESSSETRDFSDSETRAAARGSVACSFSADDEHAPTPRTGTESAEEEFGLRIRERHGAAADADELLRLVKLELTNGNMELSEFLEFDKTKTTGVVSNPGGYYRSLVRQFVRLARAAAWERAIGTQAATRVSEPQFAPTCSLCQDGLVDGEPCDCKVGQFRRELATHCAASEAAA